MRRVGLEPKAAFGFYEPRGRAHKGNSRTRGKKYWFVNRSTFARPEEKRSQVVSPNPLISLVAEEGFERNRRPSAGVLYCRGPALAAAARRCLLP